MEIIGALLILSGLLYMFLGCICVFKPIAAVGMPTRGRAVLGIFLGFVVLVIGGGVLPPDETAIPELAGTSPTPQLTQAAPPEPQAPPEPPAQSVVADVSFEEINNLFGINSSLTDLQKDNTWNQYRGLCIEWTGQLANMDSQFFGGISIGMKHLGTTITYDVSIDAPSSEQDALLLWQQGDVYTYRATLVDYGGAFLPISADWGCG